jgi:Holliday junction resolvase RusA-like endonuclease
MKSHKLTDTLRSVAGGTIQIRLNKIPSLNQFYSSKHWTFRKKLKDELNAEILAQLEQYDPVTYEGLEVYLRCNYRMDLDNCIMAVKFVVDAFNKWGGLEDDSPKYFQKIRMEVDKSLEKTSCLVELREIFV